MTDQFARLAAYAKVPGVVVRRVAVDVIADRHARGEEFVEKLFMDGRLKKAFFDYVVRKSYLAARAKP